MPSLLVIYPGGERMLVTRRDQPNPMPRRFEFPTHASALDFVRTTAPDSGHVWRTVLHAEEVRHVHDMSTTEVHVEVAHLLVRERVVVGREAERVARRLPVAKTEKKQSSETPSEAAAPAPRKEKTWIGLRVVCDATGRPVPHVKLKVTDPEGNQAYHTTADDGLVEIKNLPSGSCTVSCDLDEIVAERTVHCMRIAADIADGDSKPVELESGTCFVANVDAHKVKTGETMAKLAEEVGISEGDLAKFNFGTDDPEEVKTHLEYDVGCAKPEEDGGEWVFDDSNEPGIVLMPRAWEHTGLATGSTHGIRVRTPDTSIDFDFSI